MEKDVPKSILPKRYGRCERTILTRRQNCGHVTDSKSLHISLKEVLDLDDWWVATNKEWGLGWTDKMFMDRIIARRMNNPSYSLSDYLSKNPVSGFKSTKELLIAKGLSNKIEELESSTNVTIDITI